MANNTDWLNISQMTGGTGETALSLTALTNDSLSAKTATVVAKNTTFNVSGTSLITLQGFQPTLTLSRSTLRFDSTGGTATFTVYSNTAWTINFPSMVQSYSLSAGTGDTEVTVVVGPNPQEVGRTETGLVKDIFNVNQLYLTLVQESFIAELYVNPTEIVFDATGSTEYITIEANCDWEIEYPSWVTPSVISGGSGTTIVALTAGENNTADRTGKVIVYAGSKSVEVNLFQPLYIPTYITVTPSAWTFNYTEDGKTFIVDSFPEWTAEIISTGESSWSEAYMEAVYEIPSAMSMPLWSGSSGDTTAVYNGPIKINGSQLVAPSSGTYRVRYEITENGSTPRLSNNQYLKEIYISDGAGSISIPASGFASCSTLTTISIGDSVTSIGNMAFTGCTALSSVTIGDSLTSIPSNTFKNCTSLANISIGSSVTTIGSSAFQGCTSLSSLTLGDSVTSIGGNVFEGCTSLSSITLGDSLTSIGGNAFSGCTALSSITLGDSVTSIGSHPFTGCTSLANATINAASLPNNTFLRCTSLASITIGKGVTSIGAAAFSGCTSLSSITSLANIAPSIQSDTFKDVSPGGTLTYPIGSNYSSWLSTSAYYLGFYWWNDIPKPYIIATIEVTSTTEYTQLLGSGNTHTEITEVLIDDSILLTGNDRLKYMFSTTGQHSVKYLFRGTDGALSSGCFSGISLSSVILPDAITTIGNLCFRGCTSLAIANIGNAVTTIRDNAFSGCTSLSSITIPESFTTASSYAYLPFKNCTSLTSVTINSNAALNSGETSDNRTSADRFFGPQVTHYILGTGITVIGNYCFSACTSLSKITCYAENAPIFKGMAQFLYVPTGGTLEYPSGSDYSTWFTELPSGWTGQEI